MRLIIHGNEWALNAYQSVNLFPLELLSNPRWLLPINQKNPYSQLSHHLIQKGLITIHYLIFHFTSRNLIKKLPGAVNLSPFY